MRPVNVLGHYLVSKSRLVAVIVIAQAMADEYTPHFKLIAVEKLARYCSNPPIHMLTALA